mmetsp:Transcript_101229/g.325276  ORF Transcript_101229/g.325276 Transcript_101229/m.325276 type:complete len:227 (-) Transcript_101229:790-1470(-)
MATPPPQRPSAPPKGHVGEGRRRRRRRRARRIFCCCAPELPFPTAPAVVVLGLRRLWKSPCWTWRPGVVPVLVLGSKMAVAPAEAGLRSPSLREVSERGFRLRHGLQMRRHHRAAPPTQATRQPPSQSPDLAAPVQPRAWPTGRRSPPLRPRAPASDRRRRHRRGRRRRRGRSPRNQTHRSPRRRSRAWPAPVTQTRTLPRRHPGRTPRAWPASWRSSGAPSQHPS